MNIQELENTLSNPVIINFLVTEQNKNPNTSFKLPKKMIVTEDKTLGSFSGNHSLFFIDQQYWIVESSSKGGMGNFLRLRAMEIDHDRCRVVILNYQTALKVSIHKDRIQRQIAKVKKNRTDWSPDEMTDKLQCYFEKFKQAFFQEIELSQWSEEMKRPFSVGNSIDSSVVIVGEKVYARVKDCEGYEFREFLERYETKQLHSYLSDGLNRESKDLVHRALYAILENPLCLLRLIESMVTDLQAIHNRNVVHADIKPANAVIHLKNLLQCLDLDSMVGMMPQTLALDTQAYRIAAIDFGIAMRIDHPEAKAIREMQGTVKYMAPELSSWSKDKVIYSSKSDIYALGVSLLNMLAMIIERIQDDAVKDFLKDLEIKVLALNDIIPEKRPNLSQFLMSCYVTYFKHFGQKDIKENDILFFKLALFGCSDYSLVFHVLQTVIDRNQNESLRELLPWIVLKNDSQILNFFMGSPRVHHDLWQSLPLLVIRHHADHLFETVFSMMDRSSDALLSALKESIWCQNVSAMVHLMMNEEFQSKVGFAALHQCTKFVIDLFQQRYQIKCSSEYTYSSWMEKAIDIDSLFVFVFLFLQRERLGLSQSNLDLLFTALDESSYSIVSWLLEHDSILWTVLAQGQHDRELLLLLSQCSKLKFDLSMCNTLLTFVCKRPNPDFYIVEKLLELGASSEGLSIKEESIETWLQGVKTNLSECVRWHYSFETSISPMFKRNKDRGVFSPRISLDIFPSNDALLVAKQPLQDHQGILPLSTKEKQADCTGEEMPMALVLPPLQQRVLPNLYPMATLKGIFNKDAQDKQPRPPEEGISKKSAINPFRLRRFR